MTDERPARRPAVLAVSLVLAAGIALVVEAVLAAPFLPTNDGPHHLFSAWGRAHLDDPALDYARFFVGNVPASANGVAELFMLFEPLGWRLSHQLTVAIIAATWLAGAVLLAASFDPRRAVVGLVAGTAALGWNLYLGFFEFAWATGLGFVVLAVAVARAATPARRLVVTVMLFATALVHFYAAALTGIALAVALVARATPGQRAKEAALVAAMGLPAFLVALSTLGASSGLGDTEPNAPWAIRFAALGNCTLGGPVWRQAPLVVVVLASLVLVAVKLKERRPEERALAVTAALFLSSPLFLPWTALGWQSMSPRPLGLAASIAVALLPVEKLPKPGRVVAGVLAVAFFVSATLWARGLHVRAAREIADVLVAVDAKVPGPVGYRWPLVTVPLPVESEANILRWDPQRGLGSLFGVTQGGFPAYAHVVSAEAHTLLLRPDVAATLPPPLLRSRAVAPLRALDDDEKRRAELEPLMSAAVQTDGVIVIERPEDHAAWRARGYSVDVEEGRVILARFTGCSLDLTSTAPRAVTTSPAPFVAGMLTRTDEVPAGTTRLEALPCGLVQVNGCAPATVELSPSTVGAVTCP